ncbi:MAG: MBL fold metallo-hydrolase [Candidatus Lokiarchaeota archaeon]|nr:MBL fold metallo-hydrolase [Candidatus Lokiarchaeota archaeon]
MPVIKFLGGAREVGRSAILIESNNKEKIMLDYGVRFKEEDRLPDKTDLDNLKAVALTHCHIDHSGALPLLYKNSSLPFYTNPLSLRISDILLKDMIKISRYPYPFGYKELDKLRQSAKFLRNGIRQKISNDFHITFYDAGHIPGSISILVEVDGKKIFYTGDINSQTTNLINPAKSSEIPKIDALITESTYALKEHPPREETERDIVDRIVNIIENDGNVLIPAFGVARSQEVLLVLKKYDLKIPIYLDGLARKVCMAYSEFPNAFKDFSMLKSAIKTAQFAKSRNRMSILEKGKNIIISPSGMLKGGAAIDYVSKIVKDPASAIYLVGYQVEGTPGRKLLEEGIFEFEERGYSRSTKTKALCEVDYFDFSSHADKSDLLNYIKGIKFNNSRYVFCVHGDEKSTTSLASNLNKENYNAVAPETGESYAI